MGDVLLLKTIRETVILFLLWLVVKLSPRKSKWLSWKLHEMADVYDHRPTGWWSGKITKTSWPAAKVAMMSSAPWKAKNYRK